MLISGDAVYVLANPYNSDITHGVRNLGLIHIYTAVTAQLTPHTAHNM